MPDSLDLRMYIFFFFFYVVAAVDGRGQRGTIVRADAKPSRAVTKGSKASGGKAHKCIPVNGPAWA